MSAVVCPAILAETESAYAQQIKKVSGFAQRLQIDLMDGLFASPKSIELGNVWWPPHIDVDIHLMYEKPHNFIDKLIELRPEMVIIHAESDVHHMHMAAELHRAGIKAGLAVLPKTAIESVEQIIHSFDHLMIFAGKLGQFGGIADLNLLSKANAAKEHHPELEVGWDGGINPKNALQLAEGGIDVLNAGGYIQNAQSPEQAYNTLVQTVS